jgi:hypothetical protein
MNRPLVYNDEYFNTTLNSVEDETLGWASALLSVGSSLFGPIMGLFAPCKGQNVACGLEGITAAVNTVLQKMGEIKAALAGGQVPAEQIGAAVAQAEKFANALSDPSMVWQAQKGKDAAKLNEGKQQAAALLNEIKTVAASAAQNAQSSLGGSLGGMSTNTLLLAGAGLAVVFFMTRRND